MWHVIVLFRRILIRLSKLAAQANARHVENSDCHLRQIELQKKVKVMLSCFERIWQPFHHYLDQKIPLNSCASTPQEWLG